MIYFAQGSHGGAVKIGTTRDYETRLKALACHYGHPMRLLALWPGDREREQEIHAKFAHLRIKKSELFSPAPELAEFIGVPSKELLKNTKSPQPRRVSRCKIALVVSLWGTSEYREWLDEFAVELGLDRKTVTRDALAAWAKANGYPRPPEI